MKHKNKSLKKRFFLLLTGIFGLIVFVQLLHHFYPTKAVNLKIGNKKATEIAADFLRERGYLLEGYKVTAMLSHDSLAAHYLQRLHGWAKAQEISGKESHSGHKGLGYHWRITWFNDHPKGSANWQISVQVSMAGRVVGVDFDQLPSDSLPKNARSHVSQDEAREIVAGFLKQQHINMSGFKADAAVSRNYENRTEHHFSWIKSVNTEKGSVNLKVDVSGKSITRFGFFFGIPATPQAGLSRMNRINILATFVSSIFAFLLCIFILVVFLKKYHEGEVGIKSGVIVFIILLCNYVLESLTKFRLSAYHMSVGGLSFDAVSVLLFVLFSFIVWPFFSIMGFGAWTVGESLGRERFPKKLSAVDSLFNGKFSSLDTAESLLKGYSFGFLGLGIFAAMAAFAVSVLDAQIIGVDFGILSAFAPFLVPFLAAVSSSFLSELVFRFFGNLYLYRRLKSKWGSIFISSLVWTVFSLTFWGIYITFAPILLDWLVGYIFGVFFGYLFWRFDLLTVVTAHFTMVGVMQALPLITASSREYILDGIIALLLIFFPMVLIVLGFIKKQKFAFEADLVPRHIKRITERARMTKELEIARQVQVRLLPETPPRLRGFEIEGICIPATEIGGDYYDYIPIDQSRLGIVIGDVSGKGVPAAIYMTLTKGIIQSQVENRLSPVDTLKRVNRSLYKMMDPKSFVTLFYGIIDLDSKTLRFARAGHNPLVYFRRSDGQIKTLRPNGIALGIEKGTVFDGKLEEGCLELMPGDIIMFYTDGFSEAMNRELEEFGEKRLIETIMSRRDKPVKDIIGHMVETVNEFVNGYPQHDDMTMVIVKVF
jgi:phosphoserine phosphatase RsbU/P